MNSGAYQLFIKIEKNISIKVGALGSITFEKGYYIYTGSAMKNLSQRVARHIRTNTKHSSKLHWHIDYLLNNPNVKIIDVKLFHSVTKIECQLNQKLIKQNNVSIPVKKFGSSDCSECPAHLVKLG